jgi:hypothetical protein
MARIDQKGELLDWRVEMPDWVAWRMRNSLVRGEFRAKIIVALI